MHFLEGVCSEGAVRLQGGTATRGRVEVCKNNIWGTVCEDFWNTADARVVCKQLGLPSASEYNYVALVYILVIDFDIAAKALRGGEVPPGLGPIFLDNVKCTGKEERLVDCKHAGFGVHNCVHHEDAGVICTGS